MTILQKTGTVHTQETAASLAAEKGHAMKPEWRQTIGGQMTECAACGRVLYLRYGGYAGGAAIAEECPVKEKSK